MDAGLREFNAAVTAAVETLAAGGDGRALRGDATDLRSVYRSRGDRSAGLASALVGRSRALAYAASRMSSTHAAALAVLSSAGTRLTTPPRTVVDLGGGTGAAAIAAAQTFPDCTVTVIDRSRSALDLGREIVALLDPSVAPRLTWVEGRMDAVAHPAELAILGYSLIEADDPGAVVRAALSAAPLVAVIEPGSREGYDNVLSARDILLADGRTVVAPCPHDDVCPLRGSRDWCHFGVRTVRTARQMRLKDGTRDFEDEKFSYVVAGPPSGLSERPESRVIGRPRYGGRLVHLDLCTASGAATAATIPKSSPHYPVARRAEWGDALPFAGR